MDAIAIPAPPTTPFGRLRWVLADSLVVARRNLAHIRHIPEKLSDVTIQPILFVVLFGYVFGSAIAVPGGNYREFLMAGMFAMTLFGTINSTAIGMADDMSKGLIDRFRALPMARSAVLIGRTMSDLLEACLGVTLLALTGLAVGWRPHEGPWHTLAAFLLILLFGLAMSCAGIFIGLTVRSPESAQSLGFIVFFPLIFLSNNFVPTDGMPRVLRDIADWSPISAVTAACRDLFGNPGAPTAASPWPLQHAVAISIAWSLAFMAVFLPLGIRRYLAATTR
ncbi:MAG TPA: ABC transporter permease [Thermomicrobiales bacterium]|jgi:ABC-2 type transport system permease protein